MSGAISSETCRNADSFILVNLSGQQPKFISSPPKATIAVNGRRQVSRLTYEHSDWPGEAYRMARRGDAEMFAHYLREELGLDISIERLTQRSPFQQIKELLNG